MNIDDLWWRYRTLQYLEEMTTCLPPQRQWRAVFNVWPPPSGPSLHWLDPPA